MLAVPLPSGCIRVKCLHAWPPEQPNSKASKGSQQVNADQETMGHVEAAMPVAGGLWTSYFPFIKFYEIFR